MVSSSNRNTACPSCGCTLEKRPQRKTKCKHCGEFIFVKYTPDNADKRLMTAEQAKDAEHQWQLHGLKQQAAKDSFQYCIAPGELQRALKASNGDLPSATRGLLKPRALDGDRDALLGMMANTMHDPEAYISWKRLFLDSEIARLRQNGFRSIQVDAKSWKECTACARWHGKVVPISITGHDLIPGSCQHAHQYIGCCVGVRAAMKNPDGKIYFDHEELGRSTFQDLQNNASKADIEKPGFLDAGLMFLRKIFGSR